MTTPEFRDHFRQHMIPSGYKPWLHVGFNFSILGLLLVFCLTQVSQISLFELLAIPTVLLLGNFAVFLIHKYLLHRRTPLLARHTFDIHSKQHHLFYTDQYIERDKPEDLYILFFPWWTLALFALAVLPSMYFALSFFISPNAVWLSLFSASLYFLLYEIFHYISHLPQHHILLKIRPLRWMRQHHLVHHNPKLMHHYNFNIVYPLSDWLFGVIYKDRKSEPR